MAAVSSLKVSIHISMKKYTVSYFRLICLVIFELWKHSLLKISLLDNFSYFEHLFPYFDF